MSASAGHVDAKRKRYWLFSPAVDLSTFLGSAVIALGLLAIGAPLGLLDADTPPWAWIVAILMIDVAHVYSTGFRVYFDRLELRRRPWLYGLTPVLAFVLGLAVYTESHLWFWRTLAYLAVFHFVRQQYGWVMLYRSRVGETDRLGRWIDTAVIYAATVFPLLHWHAHPPRNFSWFLDGDFGTLPIQVVQFATPIYWTLMIVYAARTIHQAVWINQWNPGKDIVVVTTAVCWYIGIISFNSDYAFTVTNVIIHGIPYMVLVYWYGVSRESSDRTPPRYPGKHSLRIIRFVAIVWVLAYLEELLWDIGVWHERPWLFGSAWHIGSWESVLVPLLAVPQITHYVLDGFIWRRQSNQRFSELVTRSS